MAYNHFSYFSTTSPESYLAEPLRKPFMQQLNTNFARFKNQSPEEVFGTLNREGVITANMKTELLSFQSLVERLAGSKQSYDQTEAELVAYEKNILQKNGLDGKERSALLTASAFMRGYLQYSFESEPAANSVGQSAERCSWFSLIGCWTGTILVGGIIGGVLGVTVTPEGGIPVFVPPGEAGFIVGAFAGAIVANKICCKMGGDSGNAPDCQTPKSIVVNPATLDCAGHATLSVYGAGADATQFYWNNVNCIPATATTSATSSGASMLAVQQIGTSAITVSVKPNCDVPAYPKTINIAQLAGNPGYLSIVYSGNTNNTLTINTPYTYYVSGDAYLNPMNTITVEVTGSMGSASIQGTTVTASFFRSGSGTIKVTSTNTCNNSTTVAILPVTVN